MVVDEYTTTTPKDWITQLTIRTRLKDLIWKLELERDDLIFNARKMMPEYRIYPVRQARHLNRAIIYYKKIVRESHQ